MVSGSNAKMRHIIYQKIIHYGVSFKTKSQTFQIWNILSSKHYFKFEINCSNFSVRDFLNFELEVLVFQADFQNGKMGHLTLKMIQM